MMRRTKRGWNADGSHLKQHKAAEESANDAKIRGALQEMRDSDLSAASWTFAEIARRAGVSDATVSRREFAVKAVMRHNPAYRQRAKKAESAASKYRENKELKDLRERVQQLENELQLRQMNEEALNARVRNQQREIMQLRAALDAAGQKPPLGAGDQKVIKLV